jgi:uncharacterized SAM-binding protein YcdF (DUF218 family)
MQSLLASLLPWRSSTSHHCPIALILELEQRFPPPWECVRSAPDGIIVLGGAFDPRVAAGRGEVSLNDSAERMSSAVELARKYPNARLVFSGGIGQIPAAELAQRLFENLGVPAGRFTEPAIARNENVERAKATPQIQA